MVSIITVVKNGAKTIERTILSVINQDYNNFEYVVIDGVSTDGTLEILDNYSHKITTIISENDSGIYDAMNKGISIAKGEWIYFLGCDDIFYETSTLKKVFSNDLTGVHVIYGNIEFLYSHQKYDGIYDFEKLCLRSPCHQGIFYRKELFEKFGNFNIDYVIAADYDLHIKTFSGGAKWLYMEEIISVFDETGVSSMGKNDKLFRNEFFKICFDNLGHKISDLALSRLFYSSYTRYFISHKLAASWKYFSLIIKRVGAWNLIGNFFVLFFKYKINYGKN